MIYPNAMQYGYLETSMLIPFILPTISYCEYANSFFEMHKYIRIACLGTYKQRRYSLMFQLTRLEHQTLHLTQPKFQVTGSSQ